MRLPLIILKMWTVSCIPDRGLAELFTQCSEKNPLEDESEPDACWLCEIPEDIRDGRVFLFHMGLLAKQT